MSDGWDNGTAYGYNDVFDDPAMGWARWSHSMRISVMKCASGPEVLAVRAASTRVQLCPEGRCLFSNWAQESTSPCQLC